MAYPSLDIQTTPLWQRTFGHRDGDDHEEIRSRLRNAFFSFRRTVIPIAENTHSSIKHLTVHDISHIDALWEIASQFTDKEFPISPLEAFVLGGAFLLHDLGLALAAYPRGIEQLRLETFWRDSVARILRRIHHRAPTPVELESPPPEVIEQVTEETLRKLHADRAALLGTQPFEDPTGGPDFYLIEDHEIREHYGELIGRIAKSHWDDLDQVTNEFSGASLGAMPGCPSEWTVDGLKIACLLRACDACHLDARRAPALLRALKKPKGIAELHWRFQGFIQTLVVQDGQACFTSTKPFRLADREAWWLGFDLLRQADRELSEVDAILKQSRRPVLCAHSVAGIQTAHGLSKYLKTEGWTPVDTRLRVSDVAKVVQTLGGQGLYGRNPTVPVRELIQNARDAVVAHRVLERKEESWGKIHVRLIRAQDAFWLEVQDNGLGMSEDVLSGPFLDFGQSYWDSDLALREWPGLTASVFDPTGEFGIGFFSVFMAADEVKVVTRRQEDRKSETRVLEFPDRLNARPVLRDATLEEQMIEPGTLVRLRLREKPDERGGILGPMRFEPLIAHMVDKRTAWSLRDLCEWLCPALDVDLFTSEAGEPEEKAVGADDWLTIEPRRLLQRLMLHTDEGKQRLLESVSNGILSCFRTLNDESGQAIGRGCIWPIMGQPELPGHVTAGRLGGMRFPDTAGLFLGRTSRASRYHATPLATGESAETRKWASEQASLLSVVELDVSAASHAASVIRAVGAHTASLPIAIAKKGAVSFDQLREMKGLPSEVILVPAHPYEPRWWEDIEGQFGPWDDNRLQSNVFVVLSARMRSGVFPGPRNDPLKRGSHPAWKCFWMSLWGAAMEAVACAWGVELDEMLRVSRIATQKNKFSTVIGLGADGSEISHPDVDILCRPK